MKLTVSMSLDSSDTDSSAAFSGANSPFAPEKGVYPAARPKDDCWVYLFAHRNRADMVDEKLNRRFETFVHKTIAYVKSPKGKTQRIERPTVSGLIFVHGNPKEVQNYIDNELCLPLRLVKDRSTNLPARIGPREMASFMKLASVDSQSVRFMVNPLDYYAEGHQRVRITSGPLEGCEGYVVRLHRDRCLITTIGNMTVAIAGVHKESFENAEEYAESRRVAAEGADEAEWLQSLSPREREIASTFFKAKSDLDAMAIANGLDKWVYDCKRFLAAHNYDEAASTTLFILDQIGENISPKFINNPATGLGEEITDLQTVLATILQSAIPQAFKDHLDVELESLRLNHPHLPLDIEYA